MGVFLVGLAPCDEGSFCSSIAAAEKIVKLKEGLVSLMPSQETLGASVVPAVPPLANVIDAGNSMAKAGFEAPFPEEMHARLSKLLTNPAEQFVRQYNFDRLYGKVLAEREARSQEIALQKRDAAEKSSGRKRRASKMPSTLDLFAHVSSPVSSGFNDDTMSSFCSRSQIDFDRFREVTSDMEGD